MELVETRHCIDSTMINAENLIILTLQKSHRFTDYIKLKIFQELFFKFILIFDNYYSFKICESAAIFSLYNTD